MKCGHVRRRKTCTVSDGTRPPHSFVPSSPERSERDREGRGETRILIKVYHQHAHRIYSKTFLGCPTVLTAISDHLIFPRETTLLSSHRVYTGDRVVKTRTTVTDTGVRTNGAPLGAAPLSPLPHRRAPRASPLSPHSDRQVACKCSPRRHHGPRRPEGHCDRQAQLRDPHVLHLVLNDHHRVGRLPLVHLMR